MTERAILELINARAAYWSATMRRRQLDPRTNQASLSYATGCFLALASVADQIAARKKTFSTERKAGG